MYDNLFVSPLSRTFHRFAFVCLALATYVFCSCLQAQENNLFAGLPYDESLLRAKLDQYARASDTAEPPLNIHYQLLLRDLLADEALLASLPAADADLLLDLAAPWDRRFVLQDQQELGALCAELPGGIGSAAGIHGLALRFEASRQRSAQDLDTYYGSAVAALSPDTQQLVQALLLEQQATRTLVHASFDLAGFASEFPAAAGAILQRACTRFQASLQESPPTARLRDADHYHVSPLE